MTIDPDKIELKPRAPEVRETMITPTSGMAEAVESLTGLLQKITDLSDASKAILHAKDLYKKGESAKAEALTVGIFKRLQEIGKAPAGLDIISVQEKIKLGQFGELAKSIKEVNDAGPAKGQKKPEELIDRIAKVKRDSEIDPLRRPANEKKNQDLIKDIVDDVNKNKLVVDKKEEEVQVEFKDLLSIAEKKASAAVKEELLDYRARIDSQSIGEVETKKQIDSLRTKISTTVKNKVGRGEVLGEKARGEMAKKVKAGKSKDALSALADRVKYSKKGEQIFITKLEHLVVGMDKVKNKIDTGVGLQEAVRSLSSREIDEIRSLLASLSEVADLDERSPYYDDRYVEFVKQLTLDTKDVVALEKMLNTVDVHYQREALNKKPDGSHAQQQETPRRGRAESFGDSPMELDADGNPLYGMELHLLTDAQRKALYDEGEEVFRDLFIEMSDGSFQEKSYESQLAAKQKKYAEIMLRNGYSKLEQRESYMNIDMQNLFKYMQEVDVMRLKDHLKSGGKKKDFIAFHDMIDHDYYFENGVAKLKEEYMTPSAGSEYKKHKNEFEKWWYQEAAFNQRSLAYEGLFERRNQSPRMKRLNSLMEIIGVGTEKKGLANWMAMSYSMIDQQNNSYVNSEFMGKLAGFWTNQGVDFRLEDMLKEFREEMSIIGSNNERVRILDREGDVATINVFDTLNFMQEEVPNDAALRAKLGIPDWWKGKWGTYIYKYSATDARSKARRGAWDYYLSTKKNVDLTALRISDGAQTDISNKYQLMFDLSFNYAVAHKQLHQMLGNASFKQGEFELPAACAEMHLKLDPILYARAFAPRYTWLNVAFKEGWALFDPGLRDYITMAPQDYASHLTQLDKDEPLALETQNGSPTILKTFLLGNDGRAATNSDAAMAKELQGIFGKSLWHWGAGAERHEALGFMMEWGVDGDKKSAYRRPVGEVAGHLIKNRPSAATLSAIKWDAYCDIAKDPKITKYLMSNATPEAKWDYFAKTFGEHSYNHSTPSAKRSGDHPVKYGVEAFNKYVETFLAWVNDPFNQEKFDALMDVPTAINAGAVPGMAQKNIEFLILMSERMGRRELGGGKLERLWRNPDDNTTKFDTSKGLRGSGDSEWPAFKTEHITNSKFFWDPVQHKSVPESVGIGVPVDKQIMLDLIKGQRAKGRLPDNLYRKLYKDITGSVFYEKQLGPIINAYRWITLEPLFEWLAPQMGITGHELRHILSENTEKTGEKFWHYLNGGGGH